MTEYIQFECFNPESLLLTTIIYMTTVDENYILVISWLNPKEITVTRLR